MNHLLAAINITISLVVGVFITSLATHWQIVSSDLRHVPFDRWFTNTNMYTSSYHLREYRMDIYYPSMAQ